MKENKIEDLKKNGIKPIKKDFFMLNDDLIDEIESTDSEKGDVVCQKK